MSLILHNPYSMPDAPWKKGNLHLHTTQSDGVRSPQEALDAYAALGYDFIMISDHDLLTVPNGLNTRGLVQLPGNEITDGGPHMLHVGASTLVPPHTDRQRAIDAVNAEGGFAVLCHPNWEKEFNHCPQELLERWQGYAGIEIYNGVCRYLRGSGLATDRWDRLLGQGRRIWGFAHDDSHWIKNYGLAWNMVQTEGRDAAEILEALREGRFYASTGVTIQSITVTDGTIRVETENAQRIAVISDYGFREAESNGASLTFEVPEDAGFTYLRFECWGPGESMAWTQPFFVERG